MSRSDLKREPPMTTSQKGRRLPDSAGPQFGLGLGGVLDTLRDGLFHAGTRLFVVFGLILLWRTAHRAHLWWSGKLPDGTMLMGFGLFDLSKAPSIITFRASARPTKPSRATSGSTGTSAFWSGAR